MKSDSMDTWTRALDCFGGWQIATCDDGYSVRIYSSPEIGEDFIGEAYGPNLKDVINIAIDAAVTSMREEKK